MSPWGIGLYTALMGYASDILSFDMYGLLAKPGDRSYTSLSPSKLAKKHARASSNITKYHWRSKANKKWIRVYNRSLPEKTCILNGGAE